jgi:hypothetical protein
MTHTGWFPDCGEARERNCGLMVNALTVVD